MQIGSSSCPAQRTSRRSCAGCLIRSRSGEPSPRPSDCRSTSGPSRGPHCGIAPADLRIGPASARDGRTADRPPVTQRRTRHEGSTKGPAWLSIPPWGIIPLHAHRWVHPRCDTPEPPETHNGQGTCEQRIKAVQHPITPRGQAERLAVRVRGRGDHRQRHKAVPRGDGATCCRRRCIAPPREPHAPAPNRRAGAGDRDDDRG